MAERIRDYHTDPKDFEGFSVGLQLTDYFKAKEQLFVNMRHQWYDIERRLMASAGRYVVKRIKQSYNGYFSHAPNPHVDKFSNEKFRFGKHEPKNLYESIRNRSWKRDPNEKKFGQTIFAHVHSPFNGVYYGMALEEGYTWQTKGGKTVQVAPRNFLFEPGKAALREPGLYQAMDKTLDHVLKQMAKSPFYRVRDYEERRDDE